MIGLLVVLCCIVIMLVAIVILYRSELLRISGFMGSRPQTSNLRLEKGAPLPGVMPLIDAVNDNIDKVADRELEMMQDETDLLEGLANLSHDIRTPLAGAKGYVQLACVEEEAVERERLLHLAEGRLDAMRGMLDQLFDYTKVLSATSAPDKDALERIDVVALLSSVMLGHYPSFAKANIEPAVDLGDGDLFLTADPASLRRVFDNALGNILVHGQGDVCVRRKGSVILFSNAMDASGNVNCDLVFRRFYRGDASRSATGAGLGLAVVKELCDEMGVGVSASASDGVFALALDFSIDR